MTVKQAALPTMQAMSACSAYCGLPEGIENRFDLLRMAKRAGAHFGLSFGDLRVLELYVSYSKPEDWTADRRPIYTRPVFRSASDLGISTRHLNRCERKLEKLGLIFRDTRGDGGRGGYRRVKAAGQEGQGGDANVVEISFSPYCIDLRPLAVAYDRLRACAEAADRHEAQIDATRATISRMLRHANELTREAEAASDGDDALALMLSRINDLPDRTPQFRDLSRLSAMEAEITQFVEDLQEALRAIIDASIESKGTDSCKQNTQMSDAPDKTVAHKYITTNPLSVFRNRKDSSTRSNERDTISTERPNGRNGLETKPREADGPVKTGENSPVGKTVRGQGDPIGDADPSDGGSHESGLQYLKTRDVIAAMPKEWSFELTSLGGFSWRAFAYVAEAKLPELGVGDAAWREAVAVIGRRAAAVALMILDSNRSNPVCPVRSVGGALRAMTRRAEQGDLHLHRSIFGLHARIHGAMSASN